jgi:hypothetical protein
MDWHGLARIGGGRSGGGGESTLERNRDKREIYFWSKRLSHGKASECTCWLLHRPTT